MPIKIEKANDTSSVANKIQAEVYGSGYYDGQTVMIKVANTNTGATTVSFSGKTEIALKKANDQALVAGDIEAGQWITVTYNAADNVFEMQSQTAKVSTTKTGVVDVIDMMVSGSTPSGTVVYTHSLGTIPTRIDFNYVNTDQLYVPYYPVYGVSTLDKNYTVCMISPSVPTYGVVTNKCIYAIDDITSSGIMGTVTAWDATTFTVTWEKFGSGIGGNVVATATIYGNLTA